MTNVTGWIKENIGAISAGAGGLAVGGTVGYLASRRRTSKKKRKSLRRVKRKRSNTRYRKVKGRRYTPRTAGKRKDTSRRRIRYTKNGQPYVIMASGKARFISLKSARISHKRRGGKY